MNTNQLIFKPTYIEKLRQEVKNGISIDRYFGDAFPYDEKETFRYPYIKEPEPFEMIGSREKDFDNAKKLYNAYKDITPIQASSDVLWVTLGHTVFFDYIKNRWKYEEGKTKGTKEDYILTRWFFKQHSLLFRNALANLWWSVYLSVQDDPGHEFDLTEILFKNETFRVRTLGTYLIGRHRPAVRGILRFVKDNFALFDESFDRRGNFIMRYFNQLGGSKQLITLDENFFYEKLEENYGAIVKAASNSAFDTKKEAAESQDEDEEMEEL